jgi:hypothetical protein
MMMSRSLIVAHDTLPTESYTRFRGTGKRGSVGLLPCTAMFRDTIAAGSEYTERLMDTSIE